MKTRTEETMTFSYVLFTKCQNTIMQIALIFVHERV